MTRTRFEWDGVYGIVLLCLKGKLTTSCWGPEDCEAFVIMGFMADRMLGETLALVGIGIMSFVLAIGGLFLGWFSPTQAGAIGAGGALLMDLIGITTGEKVTFTVTAFVEEGRHDDRKHK